MLAVHGVKSLFALATVAFVLRKKTLQFVFLTGGEPVAGFPLKEVY